jgi:hypothetical protein
VVRDIGDNRGRAAYPPIHLKMHYRTAKDTLKRGDCTQRGCDCSMDYRRFRITVRRIFEPRAPGNFQHPVGGGKWYGDDTSFGDDVRAYWLIAELRW